jgi:hypothetical protein
MECYKGIVKAYNRQPEPPLPLERLAATRPFQHTGLDYFGPIAYKGKDGTKKKFYVALFGCLTYRAVHLEVFKDLTTESCLKALRKFFSGHGRPERMFTDNAAYFKAAQRSIALASGSSHIEWKWSTELAPWTAGTHERLVGLVKHCLRATVGQRRLRFQEWEVLIKEVARVVNSRPLCAMVEYEVSQPIRPLDFLEPWEGHPSIEFPDVHEQDPDFEPKENLASSLAKAFARNTQLLNAFKRIFHEQYLLALRERHESGRPPADSEPKVGDVVLIHDKEKQQILWRMGIVAEILKSSDHLTRSVMVRVRCPETHTNHLLKRAVISLYPLEHCSRPRVRDESPHSSDEESATEEDPEDDSYEGNDSDDNRQHPIGQDQTQRPLRPSVDPGSVDSPSVSDSPSFFDRPRRQTNAPSRLDDYLLYASLDNSTYCATIMSESTSGKGKKKKGGSGTKEFSTTYRVLHNLTARAV